MKTKYYGDKIVSLEEEGKNSVKLTLDDHSVEEVSKKMYANVVTDEPADLTKLRDLRVQPVVEDVLKVFLDWDIKTSEVEYVQALVIQSLNENMKEADEFLWKKELDQKKISDIDRVLKEKDGAK